MDNNIKVENWNGHQIRFVWHNGEWWAIGNDVAKALKYARPHKAIADNCKGALTQDLLTKGGKQKVKIIPELDIYELIFTAAKQSTSQEVKEKAENFKYWVYNVLKELRQATGLEGSQVLLMLDPEHQKEAMQKLREGLKQPTKIDYIKANTIANKAISNLYGFPKMLKKKEMTPDMLIRRQNILDDTVELMILKEKYGVDVSVSQIIYNRYKCQKGA